jgi:hypothetical protein
MNHLFFRKLIYLLCTIPLSNFALCQLNKWPEHYDSKSAQNAPAESGFILLSSGDSVKGYIKLIPFTKSYPILPAGKSEVVDISIEKINYIRINAHSVVEDSYFTDLVYLGKWGVWRLIKSKGQVGIYDNILTAPTFVYGTKMILTNGSKKTKIYGELPFVLHNGQIDPLLRKFIRKHYGDSFSKKDSKTTQELINFIVEKSVAGN